MPIMILGNVVGLVMLFLAAGAYALVTKVVGHASSNTLALVVAAPVLLLLDLSYRKYRQSTLFGRAGGRLFFIPVWLVGIGLGVAGVVTFVRP